MKVWESIFEEIGFDAFEEILKTILEWFRVNCIV